MTKMLRGMWESWFGRSQWRDERPARRLQVPGWLAAVALLGAFAGGYLIGGRTVKPADGGAVLQANRSQKAGFIDIDGKPMTRTGFVVAMYAGLKEDDAKASAKSLSDWLMGRQLPRAHPYLAPLKDGGTVWTVCVFFEGETEERATRDALNSLPQDVPDASFVYYRNNTPGWPIVRRTG